MKSIMLGSVACTRNNYREIEPFTSNIGGRKSLSLYGLRTGLCEKATCCQVCAYVVVDL